MKRPRRRTKQSRSHPTSSPRAFTRLAVSLDMRTSSLANTGRLYLKPSIKTDKFEGEGRHGTSLEIHPTVPSALPLP